ncbi:unnamed protein product [Timema podura]|uniref:Uncharacterized protein n=1 Tax=Timema podura TaxID=61482 RepID=A0ABN7P024_TIMPD|nr:unnamed protein product [Timema podura]
MDDALEDSNLLHRTRTSEVNSRLIYCQPRPGTCGMELMTSSGMTHHTGPDWRYLKLNGNVDAGRTGEVSSGIQNQDSKNFPSMYLMVSRFASGNKSKVY